jgi:hypothetical protein
MLTGMLPKARKIFAVSIAVTVSIAVPVAALASSSTAPAEKPIVNAAGEIHKLIKALPSYAPFSVTGIAFYKGHLFAGSNIGLIDLKGAVPSAVYRWNPGDAVIEGPWADEVSGSLWIQRDHDGALLRMDQAGWHLVTLPDPPNGYFSRGDVLAGFRGVSDSSGFRLVGGGFVWRREDTGGWTLEPSPPLPKYSALEGVAFSGSAEMVVARLGTCSIQPCGYAAYWREANGWKPAIPLPMCCVKQVLGTMSEAIVRGENGGLVRITRTEAVALPAPGPIDAVTRASNGRMFASVAGAGIFARDGEHWTKLLDYPDGVAPGEHWAYLAEEHGVVAFATTSVPQLQSNNKFIYSGSTALWVSAGTHWVRAALGKQATN